ncbi:MAG TPA: fibronectin type III domain-containing protein [Verrucomicrobiae bacterium]|nr:fibronectin type III domain-containing protein [Verrucomicrobiae bacterium]
MRKLCLPACVFLIAHAGNSQAEGIYSLGVSADAKVRFTWRGNAEPDLAGYKLYVGTVPGLYTNFVDVGKMTTFELPNLVRGIDYYFALTAYNVAGLESARTPELACRIPFLPAYIPLAADAVPQDLEALPNSPPAVSTIPDQALSKNRLSDAIPFTVSDIETPAAALRVSAYSSNALVVPTSGLSLEGSDTNRTLVIDPTNGQTGVSLITVTASDGAAVTTISFLVIVGQHTE